MGAVQKQLTDNGSGEDIIRNDDFFPDISLSDFRNQYRADGTVTEQRLQDALIEAIASVMMNYLHSKHKANITSLNKPPHHQSTAKAC